MITSTLHVPPPGFQVILQKPVVWANISNTVSLIRLAVGETWSNMMRRLPQEAQVELLKQSATVGCNSVLEMSINMSVDSNAAQQTKTVMLSAFGTPCIIAPIDPSLTQAQMFVPTQAASTAQPAPLASNTPTQSGKYSSGRSF